MTDEGLPTEQLPTEIAKHRRATARVLYFSLAHMKQILDALEVANYTDDHIRSAVEREPIAIFHITAHMFTKKARFHVIAALRANDSSNIHSMAVQIRVALECAGQVIFFVRSFIKGGQQNADALSRYFNTDFYAFVSRTARGQFSHDQILTMMSEADPDAPEPLERTKSQKVTDAVQALDFGPRWYAHLSKRFFHPRLSDLKKSAGMGGVTSNVSIMDQLAFATFLDYLAEQIALMNVHSALLLAEEPESDTLLQTTLKLLKAKRSISGNLNAIHKTMASSRHRRRRAEA